MTQPTKDSSRPAGRPPLTLAQVLAIVGLVAGVLVVLDFGQRLAAAQRLRASADQEATQVAKQESEHTLLETQVAYATTDAAVIEWAHSGGKLVQPGEVLVEPVIPTPLPTQPPPPPAVTPPPPNWALWWNLFFDAPLPVNGKEG